MTYPTAPIKVTNSTQRGQYNCSRKGAADIHFVLAHCSGISIKVEEQRMRRRKPFYPGTGGCGNGG